MYAIDINFLNDQKSFPLTTEVLDLLKQSDELLESLAVLGGNWTIVAGCLQTGDTVSPGVVVCENRLMKFDGGKIAPNVSIVTTKKDIVVQGKVYKDAITTKKLVFSETGVPWSYFKRFTESLLIPKGVVVEFNGAVANIPGGWELYGDAGASPIRIVKK